MKSVYIGILVAAVGLVLAVATKSKADPVPPGTVFDQVIDVRTAEEFRQDHAPGAVNIDVLDNPFHEKISKLDREKVYAVYCRSGSRSGKAKSIMENLGFKNVINLGSLTQAKQNTKGK